MNYFKLLFRALKRLIATQIYISPEDAVKRYREKGVIIGENTELYKTSIDSMRPFLVTIGSNTIITGSRILTHDASTKKALGYTKIGKVSIGDNVFVGVNCVILPNVKIGNNVIVGASTVVSKDIPDNSVVVGNPMQIIGTYDDFVARNSKKIDECPKFKLNYNMTDAQKQEMKEKLDGNIGFVAIEEEIQRLNNEI